MNKIITVGREFGSGGRELGRRLSEHLGYAYYDQEIIVEIAKRTELSEQYVQNIVERHYPSSFPIHIGRTFYTVTNPVMEQANIIFQEQCEILREMAAESDCVIVGRCADYILQELAPFRIFVYADMPERLKRCRKKAPAQEHFSDKELKSHIKRIDRNRAAYYQFRTGQKWGSPSNYDLLVNTTRVPIKLTALALAKLFL